MSVLTDLLMSTVASPFALVVLFVACAFDAVASFVPSEAVLVALAAGSATTGRPVFALVVLAAAAGAVVGDNCAYALGRRIGTERFAWMRRPRVAAAFDRARGEMLRRPARLVIVGRYIPFGRVVVNLTAGASGLAHRRFFGLSVIAGVSWAVCSGLIAVLAAALFAGNPLAAAVLAVAIALALGTAVDRVLATMGRRTAPVAG